MSTQSYTGVCHCGHTEWTADLNKEQSGHILWYVARTNCNKNPIPLTPKRSHCDTCKILSGSTYTLNQIIPKSALKITKGGNALKSYTYKGDSGTPFIIPLQLLVLPPSTLLIPNPQAMT